MKREKRVRVHAIIPSKCMKEFQRLAGERARRGTERVCVCVCVCLCVSVCVCPPLA